MTRMQDLGCHDTGSLLRLIETKVRPDWIDYNGHMTEYRYLQVFGEVTDALLATIGADLAYVESGHSYYTVETHIRHLGEAKLEQTIYSTSQFLSVDDKRLHIFHTLADTASGKTLATAEHMLLHVDMAAGKACAASARVLAKARDIASAHASLPLPNGAGRRIGRNGS